MILVLIKMPEVHVEIFTLPPDNWLHVLGHNGIRLRRLDVLFHENDPLAAPLPVMENIATRD